MLISCTSCNSKYLINSADLSPKGRTVQCAKCGNQWYQDHILVKNNLPEIEVPVSVTSINTQKSKKESKTPIPNLPSTYVKDEKVSIVNSFLVILFVVLLMCSFPLFIGCVFSFLCIFILCLHAYLH